MDATLSDDALVARLAERQVHREKGAFHTYMYHRKPSDPVWEELTERQQRRFASGFLIGASSLDFARIMKEK